MALLKCHECGSDVSSEAKICPHCGAKVIRPKAPKKPVGPIGLTVAALFLAGYIWTLVQEKPEDRLEMENETVRMEAANEFRRAFLNQVKPHLREPESLVWDKVLANDNGTIVCGIYRARNGFGGMVRDAVAYRDGKLIKSSEAAEDTCNAAVHDVTSYVD